MKKFWQLVSRKDLVFGILIFAIVIAMSFYDAANKISVKFQETAVDIQSKKYSMNIPYDMIVSAELIENAEPGTVVKGFDDMSIRTGTWNNDLWGEYVVCMVPKVDAIAVTLEDGRIFVFNRLDDETTAEVYETLLTYLNTSAG